MLTEIARGEYEELLAASRMSDLHPSHRFLARVEGRVNAGFRPSCVDPIIQNEQLHCNPWGKRISRGNISKMN